ncbi:hypothetical protein [Paenibacillus sp. 79R4]|uniref:hypothetical protein n=1 Tax=Paenibacillus sp. 79R4 TaxID=2212847 RepID=UPI0015BD36B0|nr:hypothetical protein [Paenibacillus sp. 79R4]
MLDKGLKTEHWTPEQITEHLRNIGADKPPALKNQLAFEIIAPKQGSWGKYLK